MDIFTEFYTSKQTHRKLKWVHTMGKNTLDMHGVTLGTKSSKKDKPVPNIHICDFVLFIKLSSGERIEKERQGVQDLDCAVYAADFGAFALQREGCRRTNGMDAHRDGEQH